MSKTCIAGNSFQVIGLLLVLLTAACSDSAPSKPTLLDSPMESGDADPELERLRDLQAIRMEVKPVGCLLSSFLSDPDTFPDGKYYFAPQAEGEPCPESCTANGEGTCLAAGCLWTPDPGEPPVAAECRPSEWLQVTTDIFSETATEGPLLRGLCVERGIFPNSGTGTCNGTLHPASTCEDTVCSSLSDLCVANSALEVSAVRTRSLETSIKFSVLGSTSEVRIPSQSTATNAALAEHAAKYAAKAAQASLSALHAGLDIGTGSRPCLEDSLVEPIVGNRLGLKDQTPAEVHARTTVEAYQLYREAVDRAVELNVAVADAQRRNPNVSVGNHDQMTAAALSRGHAAKLLVGGDGEYDFLLEDGLCSVPEPEYGVSKALEILRACGICPADVQALPENAGGVVPISTFDLLFADTLGDGSNGLPTAGSVRMRLMEQNGVAEDYDVLEELGLTLADFEAARRYLSQEYDAFFRDKTEELEGAGSGLPIFAASRILPSAPNPLVYAAAAGAGLTSETVDFSTGAWKPDVRLISQAGSLVELADMVVSGVGEVLEEAPTALSGSPSIVKYLTSTLGYLATTATKTDVTGRLYLCTDENGYVDARVLGYDQNAGLQIVVGESGLQCATEGNVEGTHCTLDYGASEQVLFKLDQPWLADTTGLGYAASATVSDSVLMGVGVPTPNWYLVGPKYDLTTTTPGNYQALAAGALPSPNTCRIIPIFPDAYTQAGALLTPSPKWCGHPNVECDGTFFDERIPLEDELSEDGDGVESSWKHYLALASQAAAEADLLANEYVQAGLDLDQREESVEVREQANDVASLHQLEELQRICGTNVDPADILEGLSEGSGSDLSSIEESFDCSGGGTEPDTCSCFAGKCLIDPLSEVGKIPVLGEQEDPEIEKLLRCLGDDSSVYRAVTAGDTQLCYWHQSDDENVICATPPPGDPNSEYATCQADWKDDDGNCIYYPKLECPMTINRRTGDCPDSFVPPGGTVEKKTNFSLHYFGAPRESDVTSQCKRIRNLRDGLILPEDRAAYVAGISDITGDALTWQTQERLASDRVGGAPGGPAMTGGLVFEATPNTYFELKLDGRVWKTSGSVVGGSGPNLGAWPCAQETHYGCEGNTSLFCSSIDCTNPAERLVMADRMRDAMIMLGSDFTGESPKDFIQFDFGAYYETERIKIPRWQGGFPSACPEEPFSGFSRCERGFETHYKATDPAFELWPGLPESGDSMVVGGLPVRFFIGKGQCNTLFTNSNLPPYDPHKWNEWFNERDRQSVYQRYLDSSGGLVRSPWSMVTGPGAYGKYRSKYRNASLEGLSANQPLIRETEHCDDGMFYRLLQDPTFPHEQAFTTYQRYWGPSAWGDPDYPDYPRAIALDRENALDALELLCEAGSTPWAGSTVSEEECKSRPTTPRSISDLDNVGKDLKCMGLDVQKTGRLAMLFNLPTVAADALREQSAVGSFPGLGGELNEAVNALRAALIELQSAAPLIASLLNQLGFDVSALADALVEANLDHDIAQLMIEKETAGHIGNCAAAGVGALGGLVSSSPSGAGAFAAMAVCANAAIQVGFLSDLSDLQDADKENARRTIQTNFRDRFENRAQALERIATGLATTRENLDAAIARIENLRFRGRRSLDNAVWLQSLQASQQFNINSAMRRRFNTARIRYEEAHGYAKRMAFLAKRAIEARLGLRLESIDETLPLVDAPSSWANSVCATSPVDFDEVRVVLDNPDDETQHYADAFIGAYVRKLEAVVESYRLVKNFHEGTDTAVISLRNDVFDVRARCQKSSVNMLASSGDLFLDPWVAEGCAPVEEGEAKFCVMLNDWYGDLPTRSAVDESVIPAKVIRWAGGDVNPDTPGTCGESCALTADTRRQQSVTLSAGSYLLSWYAKQRTGTGLDSYNPTGEGSVALLNEDGSAGTFPVTALAPEEVGDGWYRYTSQIFVEQEHNLRTFQVAVVPDAEGGDAFVPHEVLIGGVMLEKSPEGRTIPTAFELTNSLAQVSLEACEDTDGTAFRDTRWGRRECVLLCNSGFSGDCARDQQREYCYREASFHLSQDQIETGSVLSQSGFALGNFNYRIETLALNFVGTDVRNCENSDLPTTCYAAGFVPYSVVHRGPYFVRNHDGGDFEVPLFIGNIEHARGLATERYITNPISDSDRSLLADYTRAEFQGRPLDGHFAIRVWEDDGFDFNAIQDVQVVLNYRYWTRFD